MSATPPSDPAGLTIGNGAMVVDTADHASQALRLRRSLGVPHLTTGAVDVPVADLGDEAFAVRFDKGPEGTAGAICVVRVGNVVFLVPGSGPSVKPDDVIGIARTIAAGQLRYTTEVRSATGARRTCGPRPGGIAHGAPAVSVRIRTATSTASSLVRPCSITSDRHVQ